MKLTDLEPQFLARDDDMHWHQVESLNAADGIQFVCPKCFQDAHMVRAGVHSVVCWSPSVPQSTLPRPGRWSMIGTGYSDLTLVAGSSSVLLKECGAHFFIQHGDIKFV